MPQLTLDDRTLLIGHLTRTRDLLLSEIASLRPDQWTFRPDEESWTIAECADHIATIEKLTFSMVSKRMQSAEPNPQRAAEVQKKTPWILEAVPSRHARVKVPPASKTPVIRPRLRNSSNSSKTAAPRCSTTSAKREDRMHDRVSPHPVFKDLDGCQWLFMISLHSERHAAQIAEVKSHADFPK